MTTACRRPRATLTGLCLGVVVAGVTAACVPPAQSDTGPVVAPTGNVASGHVHGLGIDPGDGLVYVATHRGLVRLEPDGAESVGDSRHDLMGFAVTGPAQYLASGHPGEPREEPAGSASSLGLVRSTDGGRTWTEVSLGGAADLHAITVAGAVVYGWDSLTATVQASRDGGRTWEPRSRGSLADLAVDPTDPQHLWATTPEGLAESRDSGHTFTLMPPIPAMSGPLAFVETVPDLHGDREPDLVGVDTSGRVWGRYGDAWQVSGDLGAAPAALAVVGPDRYLAATAEAVVSSEDAGRTWTTLAPVTP